MEKRSKSISLVCFGFGLTAKYFVKELLKNKYKINLITTSRSKSSNKKFLNINYKNFYFDNNKFDKKIKKYILNASHVLVSIPPRDRKDFVIENFYNEISLNKKIKWLGYLSSTSVYGDHDGKWVNEKSKLLTNNNTGINRIVAENEWLKLNRHQFVPIASGPLTHQVVRSDSAPFAYPPTYPPIFLFMRSWFEPKEFQASDLPAAEAWYSNQPTLWVPATRDELIKIHDRVTPIFSILFTPASSDVKLYSQMLQENSEWAAWADVIRRQKPPDLPQSFVTSLPPNNDYLLLSIQKRWN